MKPKIDPLSPEPCPRRLEIRKDAMALMVAEDREYEVKDVKLQGFVVRVSPKGVRTFVFRWSQDGKDARARLGRYPTLPVAAARNKAEIWFGMVADGKDPRVEKAEKKAEKKEAQAAVRDTMADLITRYELEVLPGHKANTRRDYKSVLKMLKAAFGPTPARALDLDAIKAYHQGLAAMPRTANRHVAVLSSVLSRGEEWNLRAMRSNPCYLIERFPEVKRTRSFTPAEAKAFGQLLARKEKAYPAAVAMLRLMLFTGARPGELQALQWAWVDLQAGVITIPKEHHKTGRKTGEDRCIGLGPRAIAILKAQKKDALSKWVFPNAAGTGTYGGLSTFWKRLHRPLDGSKDELVAAGILGFHMYDLRHTWATWARKGGANLEDLADMLGHTDIKMARRYAHALPAMLRSGAISVERALQKRVRK